MATTDKTFEGKTMRALGLWTLLLLAGCSAETTLTLDTSDLPVTGPASYALWLGADNDGFDLVGTFSDNDGGTFTVADLDAYTDALVTVEATDSPTTPGAEILRGDVTADGADLAFSLEFDISGGVSLWTPTDGIDDNPTQGAWFMERINDVNNVALDLTAPMSGWSFTGWTETQGWYLPMGSFSAADADDSGCYFCGDSDVVGVPGEDFLDDLPDEIGADVDLADGTSSIVISISPDVYDISPDVYDISPDVYDISPDVYDLGNFRFSFDVLAVDVPAGTQGAEYMPLDSVLVAPSGGLTAP